LSEAAQKRTTQVVAITEPGLLRSNVNGVAALLHQGLRRLYPQSFDRFGRGSTFTFGHCLCNSRACSQWVVACHPAKRPASASTKAPVQTGDPTMRLTFKRANRAQ
jgi:hypothetical protein